jgi:hypothetical protein
MRGSYWFALISLVIATLRRTRGDVDGTRMATRP